jgi:hypothetical protein
MRLRFTVALFLGTLFFLSPAGAVTIRYALVIGNNVGVDDTGKQPYPPLRHAEREAKLLRQQLVGLSNFDSSKKRTRLLLGAGRSQVEAAFHSLAAQKTRDEALLGEVDSIFLLYFTGHGQEGRLLLEDGSLESSHLAELFNSIDADFSVGVFDACYAASLNGMLSEKGIRPTPGVNLIRKLPDEVLSVRGSIWFVSSGPGAASYEDARLGGVFTHFFIEALSQAEQEGPGITLEKIWQYVRQKTIDYTVSHKRKQVPEQIISRLRMTAPVYFSFPVERNATLLLSEELSGRFTLTYANGQLTEVFDKRAGRPQEIAVYPGRARLILLDEGAKRQSERSFNVPSGGTMVLHTLAESGPVPAVGQSAEALWAKGLASQKNVYATKVETGLSLLTGVGYQFSSAAEELLNPRHLFGVPLRFDWGRFVGGLDLIYGYDHRDYEAWEYETQLAGGGLLAGFGWDFGPTRLTPAIGFRFAHIWQHFKTDDKRTGWQLHPLGAVHLLLPRKGRVMVALSGEIGPVYLPGAALGAKSGWNLSGGVGITGFYRIL